VGTAEINSGSASQWLSYEQGKTIGMEGSEFGEIVLDDELAQVGRVTLERLHSPQRAPWAITCGAYGIAVHTIYFGDEASARAAAEAIKPLIERIAAVAEELGDEAWVKEGEVFHVAPPLKSALDALIEGYP
jgi:hypothetical protein